MFDSGGELVDVVWTLGAIRFDRRILWWFAVSPPIIKIILVITLAFWAWMVVHCCRFEEDRAFWLVVMLLFPPACLAYFVARWAPNTKSHGPGRMRQWFRGRELERLEMATLQIGNPYHFIQYGDALREVGLMDKARGAYLSAIERDASSIQALWGLALVELHGRQMDAASERLQQVLALDPQYKFGDVSLAYAKVLREQGQVEDARQHLDRHMQRWRHPEAMFLLAELQASAGEIATSKETLQALLMDINSCPAGLARQYAPWRSRARSLLKRLSAPQV